LSELYDDIIRPHGGTLVDRVLRGEVREAVRERAERLVKVPLNRMGLSDLELVSTGAFSPLTGFMRQADYDRCVAEMHLANGLVWAIPVTLAVGQDVADLIKEGQEVALCEKDRVLAVMEVAEKYPYDKEREAREVYRTTEEAHPGVARLYRQGEVPRTAPHPGRDAAHVRPAGLALRRRLPDPQPHPPRPRVHPENSVRDRGRPVPPSPGRRDYAGPREAIFHAIARKNYGCTHFIVGRDHAGVGKYYGTYDAQNIFDQFPPEEIGIVPFRFEHAFYCRKCGGIVSAKTCPHGKDDWIFLSGTQVREMLERGEMLPEEFTRPEVARVLLEGVQRKT